MSESIRPNVEMVHTLAKGIVDSRQKDSYGRTWKPSLGVKGCFAIVSMKYDRLVSQVWDRPDEEIDLESANGPLDQAIDLVNYASFLWLMLDEMREERAR